MTCKYSAIAAPIVSRAFAVSIPSASRNSEISSRQNACIYLVSTAFTLGFELLLLRLWTLQEQDKARLKEENRELQASNKELEGAYQETMRVAMDMSSLAISANMQLGLGDDN